MSAVSLLLPSTQPPIFLCLLLQSLAYGQFISFLPGIHKTPTRLCTSDKDCRGEGSDENMICWWLYDGCNYGHCTCDPRTHLTHSNGRCVRVKHIDESCDGVNDSCSDRLECQNGTCQCPHKDIELSSKSICLLPNSKPLSSKCNPSLDVCYHESAYGFAYGEVECFQNTGLCQCKDGYKQDRRTCRRLHIWETGCKKDYYCEGGAVCVDEQCKCPTGYKSVAGNTKCARVGAFLDLPLRARCDEINERRYCSNGLVCHRCKENEAHPICAKYLPGLETDKSPLYSYGANVFPNRRHLLIIIISYSIYLVVAVR